MVDGLQNPDMSFDELYEQARQAMPELKSLGDNFLADLQRRYPKVMDGVYFQQGALKDPERALAKIITDYDGDHSKIGDLVRGRFIAETSEQIEILRHEIAASQNALGIEVTPKDLFAEPTETHFRAINAKLRLPNGHLAEFRVDQADMLLATEGLGHKLYEEIQDIERRAKVEGRDFTSFEIERHQSLVNQQRVLYDPAADKAGLDRLLNEKGRVILEANRGSSAYHAAALDEIAQLSDVAKAARTAARGLKVTKLGIITGIAVTGGIGGLIHYAHDTQRDIAGSLHEQGKLSEGAYQSYLELNEDVESFMQAENIAGQGWLFLISTPAVEAQARALFEEFSNKHNLAQEVHDMLGMSMFDGNSIRGEIAVNTYKNIPDSLENAPASLHALITAKQSVEAAQDTYSQVYGQEYAATYTALPRFDKFHTNDVTTIALNSPEVKQAQAGLDIAQKQFQYAFDEALSNPEGIQAIMGKLSDTQLFNTVSALAAFDGQEKHPLVQQYLDAQAVDADWYDLKEMWNNASARDDAEATLKQNPEVMRQYMQTIFAANKLEQVAEVTVDALEENIDYITACVVMENVQAGRKVEPLEELSLRDILNDSNTEIAVLDALSERYGDHLKPFLVGQEDRTKPAQQPSKDVEHVSGGTDNYAFAH